MYELTTGNSPFKGDSGIGIIGKLVYENKEIKLDFPSYIPTPLKDLITTSIRRDPNQRFQSAEELEAALAEVAFEDPWTRHAARAWWELHMPVQEPCQR